MSVLLAQTEVAPGGADRTVPISDNNWLDAFRIPFGDWITQTVDWINTELVWLTDAIKWPFKSLFNLIMNENPSRDSIMSISWLWLVIGMFLLGSFMRNTRVGLMVAGMTGLCGFLGQEYWEQVSKTFGMITISVVLCVLIGVPLGILCGRIDAVWNVTRPILDAMQVIHSFVWMIPFIFFFGLGNVAATMVTMVYALPPLVRLTNLGIRQVPEDVVEASRSYGANERRVLTDVQLPLARPAIMTGFNQTLLLAFSMLGIAAIMGADGLGKLIFRAINNVNIALGAGAGLTFFLVAVVLDRISQPEQDDGLSLVGRIQQSFAFRRDAEGTYLAMQEQQGDVVAPAPEPEITEYPEPVRAAERTGLMLVVAGSVVAAVSTLLTWGNNAGGVSSWGTRLDESLPGQSFNGLSASGGSFFGIFVLGLAVVAVLAAVRPLVTIPDGVSNLLNRLQGLGLIVLGAILAISLVLNLAGVGFDGLQLLAFAVFGVIAVLIALDVFARGAPRLANDGALIMAIAMLGVSVAWLIEQPSPFAVDYSDGIGTWVAIIGSGVAVVGGLMALLAAPYAARVPLAPGFQLSSVAIAIIAGLLLWGGATAAWVVDERAGADAANRIFVRGLTSNGPLMGLPVLIFGLAAVALILFLGVVGPIGPTRWRIGTVASGLSLAVAFSALAFTLSMTRNGDTDYFNDKGSLSGAGVLLAIAGAGVLFSAGRSVIGDYRRRRVYLGDSSRSVERPPVDIEELTAELVGAAQ